MKNMKKIMAMLFASVMLVSLAGCGKSGLAGASAENKADEGVEVYENEDGTYTYEGRIGSTMKTQWFNFTINDAYYTKDAIGGYTPSDGNVLVVVDMTVKNTFSQSIDMYTYDFQLQWNDDADDAYSFPVETSEKVLDDQFDDEYTLKVDKEASGCYIFEAPEGNEDFSVSYLEYDENDNEGDLFFVYFSADEK